MSVRSGNRERGWNDPPEFLHSEESDPNTTKKTALNKRVNHDLRNLGSTSTEKSELPKLSAPPVSKLNDDSNTEAKTSSSKVLGEEVRASEVSLEQIEKILNEKIDFCRQNNVQTRICDDIVKRVKMFSSNWEKLNENVKLKMFNLAKNLDESKLSVANDLHVKLIMDYPSEVSLWMVGIKRLIQELLALEQK